MVNPVTNLNPSHPPESPKPVAPKPQPQPSTPLPQDTVKLKSAGDADHDGDTH
jgi:hypothetical protein